MNIFIKAHKMGAFAILWVPYDTINYFITVFSLSSPLGTQLAREKCSVSEHQSYNQSGVHAYITRFNIDNTASFEVHLKPRYNIKEAIHAHWIKVRNANSKPFLIILNRPKILQQVDIPGESNIKVYGYMLKLLHFTNCLQYTHTLRKNVTIIPDAQNAPSHHVGRKLQQKKSCTHVTLFNSHYKFRQNITFSD